MRSVFCTFFVICVGGRVFDCVILLVCRGVFPYLAPQGCLAKVALRGGAASQPEEQATSARDAPTQVVMNCILSKAMF